MKMLPWTKVLKLLIYEQESLKTNPKQNHSFYPQVLTGLNVHVHQRSRVDVLEPSCDLKQQIFQFQLWQVAEPPVVLCYDIGQRAAVAVFVLDEHVVILSPGRVVPHNVGMLAQHSVGIHLP